METATQEELPEVTTDLEKYGIETLKYLPEPFQFIDKVLQFLTDKGWTDSRLAKAAGIAPSTLSQVLNRKYSGDMGKMTKRLSDVIEGELEKSKAKKVTPGFIETTASKKVFDVAKMCRMFNQIGVVYADAGFGKTESVREYSRQVSNVILIEADPGYTPSVLFRELHDKLGNGGYHNLHQAFQECVERLKGSSRLLIIDEAEQLPYKSLEMVRRLHDKAEIGILLTGMQKLLGNLRGFKGQYAQLYSRIFIATKLEPISESDTENIVKRLLGDVDGIWRVFYKECNGNTRRLFKMIKLSVHIADKANCKIDAEVVTTASGYLKVERMY